jgi:hypothetical protein
MYVYSLCAALYTKYVWNLVARGSLTQIVVARRPVSRPRNVLLNKYARNRFCVKMDLFWD